MRGRGGVRVRVRVRGRGREEEVRVVEYMRRVYERGGGERRWRRR